MREYKRISNIKYYTRTSALVPLLNYNALDGWDIYDGRTMQQTPRKHTKPTYTKDDLREGHRLDRKMMWRMT
jgi:hypothetical protein